MEIPIPVKMVFILKWVLDLLTHLWFGMDGRQRFQGREVIATPAGVVFALLGAVLLLFLVGLSFAEVELQLIWIPGAQK